MIPSEEIARFEQHAANAADAWRGIIGSIVTFGSFTVSTLEKIETGLRILSLVIGIAVGVATLWSICRRSNRVK